MAYADCLLHTKRVGFVVLTHRQKMLSFIAVRPLERCLPRQLKHSTSTRRPSQHHGAYMGEFIDTDITYIACLCLNRLVRSLLANSFLQDLCQG